MNPVNPHPILELERARLPLAAGEDMDLVSLGGESVRQLSGVAADPAEVIRGVFMGQEAAVQAPTGGLEPRERPVGVEVGRSDRRALPAARETDRQAVLEAAVDLMFVPCR